MHSIYIFYIQPVFIIRYTSRHYTIYWLLLPIAISNAYCTMLNVFIHIMADRSAILVSWKYFISNLLFQVLFFYFFHRLFFCTYRSWSSNIEYISLTEHRYKSLILVRMFKLLYVQCTRSSNDKIAYLSVIYAHWIHIICAHAQAQAQAHFRIHIFIYIY